MLIRCPLRAGFGPGPRSVLRSLRIAAFFPVVAGAVSMGAPSLAGAATVAEVVDGNCSTDAVKGLADQIIEESNCIHEGAFVLVPDLPNLDLDGVEYPYMEAPARDALVAALQAAPDRNMQINSMLRTLPQQYLLYRWYQQERCGISLAASPGTSNHESGLAVDIQQYDAWRTTLQNHGFAWQGSVDPWHYDYVGPGAVDLRGTDVLAFQRLWNRNHPEDLIDEDGIYGTQTGTRIAASPTDGFPLGADCGVQPTEGAPDVHLALDAPSLSDVFADGASSGARDTFVGDTPSFVLRVENRGDEPASAVRVTVELPGAHVAGTEYLVESDAGGAFAVDPANATAGPEHGALPATVTFDLGALTAGETKRLTVRTRATTYAVDRAAPLAVRAFVAEVAGHYTQASFGGAVDDPESTQTFNGGRLEVALDLDVYDRASFAWESDRSEGWSTAAGAATPRDGLLVASAPLASPTLDIDLATIGAVAVTLVSPAGGAPAAGQGKLYFGFDGAPAEDETRTALVSLDGAGTRDVLVDLRGPAAGAARLTSLRYAALDPSAPAPALDALAFTDDVVPPGAVVDTTDEDAGCACRVGDRDATVSGTPAGRRAGELLAGILAATFVLRRRRRPSA